MSALEATIVEPDPRRPEAESRLPVDLGEVMLEIAASERALDTLLVRASRLHESGIQHAAGSCLLCFSQR
ncbi:hypothetical protein [Nocardioides sp. BYT-33-1]|uniref:hypothetical protein n=1 Tax=Nocardioides sp. BYT-33-1 TaxID=3416952 RepID=UPI003F5393FE